MAIIMDHVPVTIPTGVMTFTNFPIPDGIGTATIRLARCTTTTPLLWPNTATCVNSLILLSTDGGVTFPSACGFGDCGGIIVDPEEPTGERPESFVTCTIPGGTGRIGKAELTVTNGPLVSLLTVSIA